MGDQVMREIYVTHADPSDSRTFAILTIRFLSLFLTCKKIPRSEGGGGGREGGRGRLRVRQDLPQTTPLPTYMFS